MFNNHINGRNEDRNQSSTYDRNNINSEIYHTPVDKSITSIYEKEKYITEGEKPEAGKSRTPGFYTYPQTPTRFLSVHRDNNDNKNNCSTHPRGLMELGLRSTFLLSDFEDQSIGETKVEIDKKKIRNRPRHSLSLPSSESYRL